MIVYMYCTPQTWKEHNTSWVQHQCQTPFSKYILALVMRKTIFLQVNYIHNDQLGLFFSFLTWPVLTSPVLTWPVQSWHDQSSLDQSWLDLSCWLVLAWLVLTWPVMTWSVLTLTWPVLTWPSLTYHTIWTSHIYKVSQKKLPLWFLLDSSGYKHARRLVHISYEKWVP